MGLCRGLVVAALLLGATLGPATGTAQPLPPQEARVNLLSQGEPDNLDPARASFAFASAAAVGRQVFEPLLRFDAQLQPQPAAAESYEVSPDGLTVTFHLRTDGRWSDGQPVTAGQFEYAWQRLLDPALGADYAGFFTAAGITSARAVDDSTFEVRLSQPFGALADLAALWVAAPVRPDVVSANPDSWADEAASYIGNGPFLVSEWVHQDHLTLRPNPYYAAHLGWPTPTLTRVTVTMLSSGEADLAAYRRGEREWAQVPDADINQVLNDPALAGQTQQFNDLTTFWLQLNTTRAPLSDVKVRRALAKGLDRTALVRDLASGISLPTTSVLPRGMPGFAPGLGRDLDFDAVGGRELLAQANASNLKLSFSYPRTGAGQRRAEYLRDQWQAHLGINVEPTGLEAAAFQSALAAHNYDVAFGGWAADYPDPQDWFAPVFGCGAAFNVYGYCNPLFDQIVARADTNASATERLAAYGQAQTLLAQDVPVVPLFVRGRLAVVQPWVRGDDGGTLPMTALDEFPGSLLLDKAQILPH